LDAASGTGNAIGFVADYSLSRHFDTYVGSVWIRVAGGLASGYLHTSTVTTTLGLRLRFWGPRWLAVMDS